MNFPRLNCGITLLVLCGLAACRTPTADQQAALVQSLVTDAAAIGAGLDLSRHPDRRPIYVAARSALDKLIADGRYNALDFQAALQSIPADVFRGEDGALLTTGVLSVWSAATSFIDLADSPPLLRAAIIGARNGLDQALQANPARRARGQIKQVRPPPH